MEPIERRDFERALGAWSRVPEQHRELIYAAIKQSDSSSAFDRRAIDVLERAVAFGEAFERLANKEINHAARAVEEG